ncbi:Aste57867_19251 [Aphanomyces stellatus]|uniref:Aste57867_19251 protein n=1 Tax=Aphanomyces stellatus TaxID=120398 RepID=A0A485LCX4_9STRA|nr:hypothetical protein As57867_019187 [Aphanomyces stellatus]VFT95971.1 Aste57867_19251 [Aphanomyces stellatus]
MVMPVVYEVLNRCADAAAAAALLKYMQEGHHEDMLNTGCFTKSEFEQCAPTIFRSRYVAATQADLDRYLAEHAAAMRDDFQVQFPTGEVVCERMTWTSIGSFGDTAHQ